MYHPYLRPRRLRVSEGLRAMVRETVLQVEDLVYPLFLVPGEKIKKEISSVKSTSQADEVLADIISELV